MTKQPSLDMPAAVPADGRVVPIADPKLRVLVLAMLGLRAARSVLEQEGKFAHGLAGMQVARTLIEREYFQTEAEVHRRLPKVMAAAGVDLSAWQAWAFKDGGEAVVCRPFADAIEEVKG